MAVKTERGYSGLSPCFELGYCFTLFAIKIFAVVCLLSVTLTGCNLHILEDCRLSFDLDLVSANQVKPSTCFMHLE